GWVLQDGAHGTMIVLGHEWRPDPAPHDFTAMHTECGQPGVSQVSADLVRSPQVASDRARSVGVHLTDYRAERGARDEGPHSGAGVLGLGLDHVHAVPGVAVAPTPR